MSAQITVWRHRPDGYGGSLRCGRPDGKIGCEVVLAVGLDQLMEALTR
jgi:hypothetical protein